MRWSLASLVVLATLAEGLAHKHKCQRSSVLTPSASDSPSSVIVSSSATPTATPVSSSFVSETTLGASTPSGLDTTLSPSSTPTPPESSTDLTPTPGSGTSVTAGTSSNTPSIPSSSYVSSSTPSVSTTLDVSSTSDTSAISTTPTPSSLSIATTSSVPPSDSATPTPSSSTLIPQPTAFTLLSSGAGSGTLGSPVYYYSPQPPTSLFVYSSGAQPPSYMSVAQFYLDPSTGYTFLVYQGIKTRYTLVTTYDTFNEYTGDYDNENPGYLTVWDLNDGLPENSSGYHYRRLTCSRTGASFGCTSTTPAGVFNTFVYLNNGMPLEFGSTVPTRQQSVTFSALDVY